MCSYNRVNGSYGCQNSKLLNGVLKEELGFQGYGMIADLTSIYLNVLTRFQ
jgi:beta-glucosidase-like glycosyl hydrolase